LFRTQDHVLISRLVATDLGLRVKSEGVSSFCWDLSFAPLFWRLPSRVW
jgi:hypothetical protein